MPSPLSEGFCTQSSGTPVGRVGGVSAPLPLSLRIVSPSRPNRLRAARPERRAVPPGAREASRPAASSSCSGVIPSPGSLIASGYLGASPASSRVGSAEQRQPGSEPGVMSPLSQLKMPPSRVSWLGRTLSSPTVRQIYLLMPNACWRLPSKSCFRLRWDG